jgi:hypothetical protein
VRNGEEVRRESGVEGRCGDPEVVERRRGDAWMDFGRRARSVLKISSRVADAGMAKLKFGSPGKVVMIALINGVEADSVSAILKFGCKVCSLVVVDGDQLRSIALI